MRYNEYAQRRRVLPPRTSQFDQPRTSQFSLCRCLPAQFLCLCLFSVISILYMYRNSHVEPVKIIQKENERTGTLESALHIVRGDYISDSNVFVSFKGGRKGELTFRKNPLFTPSKCRSSLQRKLSANNWSGSVYVPAIHMLMNSQLLNQSEYNRLRPYFMPFGYRTKSKFGYKDIIQTLRLFPAEQSIFKFANREQPQCVTCAVVCNGGILNGSRKGQEIDRHHMVLRLNKAVRRKHEMDVGNRTTHYFFFDRSLRETSREDVPKDEGMMYVFVPCRDNDYKYIRNVVHNKDPKINASAKNIRILHPDFIRYIHKIWVKSPGRAFRPTTGTIMLFTALFAGCDQVSVYGMGYNDNFTLYYYDKKFRLFKMARASHDTKSELKILQGLHQMGAIQWYQRGIADFFH